MSEGQGLRRTAGVRLLLGETRVGGVLRLKCPELMLETVDATPLDAGYRRVRPGRRTVGDMMLEALHRPGDPGQAQLITAYVRCARVRVALTLPTGAAVRYEAYVHQLKLGAERPGAPALLTATLRAAGEAEVSG